MASYSAGRDIASESELTTGIKFDIAATDQIQANRDHDGDYPRHPCAYLHPLYVVFADSNFFAAPM